MIGPVEGQFQNRMNQIESLISEQEEICNNYYFKKIFGNSSETGIIFDQK